MIEMDGSSDDELVELLLDGELDAATERAVTQRVATDPLFRQRWIESASLHLAIDIGLSLVGGMTTRGIPGTRQRRCAALRRSLVGGQRIGRPHDGRREFGRA